MIKQYLDYAGLEVLWGKIKTADIANEERIETLKNSIAFEAETYSKALQYATTDNIGKNIIIHEEEGIYQAGPYIILGENRIQCLLCDTEAEVGMIQVKLSELEDEINIINSSLQDIDNILSVHSTEISNLKETDSILRESLKSLEESLTSIDLNNYYDKEAINELLEGKHDRMDAISTIDIENLK